MFNWLFETKPQKLYNVGRTTVWFTVDCLGKKIKGYTYQGAYDRGEDVCWNSYQEARFETDKGSKIGLFGLADGTFLPRERVYLVSYETIDHWASVKESFL